MACWSSTEATRCPARSYTPTRTPAPPMPNSLKETTVASLTPSPLGVMTGDESRRSPIIRVLTSVATTWMPLLPPSARASPDSIDWGQAGDCGVAVEYPSLHKNGGLVDGAAEMKPQSHVLGDWFGKENPQATGSDLLGEIRSPPATRPRPAPSRQNVPPQAHRARRRQNRVGQPVPNTVRIS